MVTDQNIPTIGWENGRKREAKVREREPGRKGSMEKTEEHDNRQI